MRKLGININLFDIERIEKCLISFKDKMDTVDMNDKDKIIETLKEALEEIFKEITKDIDNERLLNALNSIKSLYTESKDLQELSYRIIVGEINEDIEDQEIPEDKIEYVIERLSDDIAKDEEGEENIFKAAEKKTLAAQSNDTEIVEEKEEDNSSKEIEIEIVDEKDNHEEKLDMNKNNNNKNGKNKNKNNKKDRKSVV